MNSVNTSQEWKASSKTCSAANWESKPDFTISPKQKTNIAKARHL